jgi:hypothetical protein
VTQPIPSRFSCIRVHALLYLSSWIGATSIQHIRIFSDTKATALTSWWKGLCDFFRRNTMSFSTIHNNHAITTNIYENMHDYLDPAWAMRKEMKSSQQTPDKTGHAGVIKDRFYILYLITWCTELWTWQFSDNKMFSRLHLPSETHPYKLFSVSEENWPSTSPVRLDHAEKWTIFLPPLSTIHRVQNQRANNLDKTSAGFSVEIQVETYCIVSLVVCLHLQNKKEKNARLQ